MPRNDLTELVVIADRSGSMSSCRAEAENGVNNFIDKQKEVAGECLLTLIQFDSEYEVVCAGVPVNDAPKYKLVPRDMTAMYRSVGRAIDECGQRLAAMPEASRPGLVVFVITTDGMDNVSCPKYTRDRVAEMVKHQQEQYNWQFTFLGANIDAAATGKAMGMMENTSAQFIQRNAGVAYMAAGANVERMRTASLQGRKVENAYTEEERSAMVAPSFD